jgi:hypothetical protein
VAKVSPVAYSNGDTAGTRYSGQTGSLRVEIDPIRDAAREQRYFGADLLCLEKRAGTCAAGIFAVHVSVLNAGSGAAFIVQRRDLSMTETSVDSPELAKTSVDAGEKLDTVATRSIRTRQAIAVPLMGLMSLAAGAEQNLYYTDLQERLMLAEFRDATLPAGQQADGFVYFPESDGRALLGTFVLKAYVPGGHDPIEVRIRTTP